MHEQKAIDYSEHMDSDNLQSQQIEERLRELILTAQLAPDSNMTQAGLIKMLGCGRTPLREALHRLNVTKEVAMVPNKGIYIPQIDVMQLTDAMETLYLIYPLAMELAAVRASEEQLGALKAALDTYNGSSEPVGSRGLLDFAFHKLAAEACGNEYLAQAITRACYSVVRFGYALRVKNRTFAQAAEVAYEHTELYEALRARDGKSARETSQRHFAPNRVSIIAAIQN